MTHRRAKSRPLAKAPRTPLRTCVGCRAVDHQSALVRLARDEVGNVRIGRRLAGRGAWLCAGSVGCFQHAARTGGFSRAFRSPVSAEQLAQVAEELFGADASTAT